MDASLNQPCRVQEECAMHCKLLLYEGNNRYVYLDESTMLYRQHGGNSVGAKDVGGIRYLLHSLHHAAAIRMGLLAKKRQATIFSVLYQDSLSQPDRCFLQNFSRKRSGCQFYWRWRLLISDRRHLFGMMVLG